LKPVWTYGIELCGCASKTNVSIIQRYQSKLLRIITNAPWYVTNQTLHTDLRIQYVQSVRDEYTQSTAQHWYTIQIPLWNHCYSTPTKHDDWRGAGLL